MLHLRLRRDVVIERPSGQMRHDEPALWLEEGSVPGERLARLRTQDGEINGHAMVAVVPGDRLLTTAVPARPGANRDAGPGTTRLTCYALWAAEKSPEQGSRDSIQTANSLLINSPRLRASTRL
jgi:hypothetical protein